MDCQVITTASSGTLRIWHVHCDLLGDEVKMGLVKLTSEAEEAVQVLKEREDFINTSTGVP